MNVKNSKSGKKARIEIIPLIDVIMFLLATFVLFTLTMNKTQTIDINLPKGSPPDPNAAKPEPIAIDSNGGFFLGQAKKQVTWEDLISYIQIAKREKGENAKFLIQGEEQASFGPAVQLLDEARKLELKGMSIDTTAKKTVH